MSEKTVLCVDDENHILQSLKRLLRREGYRLLTAASGREGLEMLQIETVQLVISDQRMPEMTGVEFLEKVKERHPDVVRVVLSGYADAALIVDAVNEGGIYRFLTKPWNDEDLKIAIRQCLAHYDIMTQNQEMTEQIRRKNEELRQLNEELEAIVQARTRSLRLSQDVLEKLPLAVVGVGLEGWLVLTNELARKTYPWLAGAAAGTHVRRLFPPDVTQVIEGCLAGQGPVASLPFEWHERPVLMRIDPLMTEKTLRGCILLITDGGSTGSPS
jgi:response regulator RpfG family c-di-GMP phosphodiesterase